MGRTDRKQCLRHPCVARLSPQGGFGLDPKWLQWAKALQSIAQNGLTFAQDPYDRERYTQLQKVAVEIMSGYAGADFTQVVDLFQTETGIRYSQSRRARGRFSPRTKFLWFSSGRTDAGACRAAGPMWARLRPRMAEREVREESGYRTRAVKLLAIYDRDRHGHPPLPFHVYKIFLQCDLLDENPKPNPECSRGSFFPGGETS